MALLDIDKIETGLVCESGGLDVPVLKPVELGIRDERGVGPSGRAGGLVEDRSRIEQWVVVGQDGSVKRGAARRSQLQPDEQVVAGAVGRGVGRSGLAQEPPE